MARVDYLETCKRLGIVPAPSPREWATAFGELWRALGPVVYWDERAREYWWDDAPKEPEVDWDARHAATERRARVDCAKGKHWLGLRADLTPETQCFWGWCDFGKVRTDGNTEG